MNTKSAKDYCSVGTENFFTFFDFVLRKAISQRQLSRFTSNTSECFIVVDELDDFDFPIKSRITDRSSDFLFLILPGYSVERSMSSFLPPNLALADSIDVRSFFQDQWRDKMGSYRHWPFISSVLNDAVKNEKSVIQNIRSFVILTPDFGWEYFSQEYLDLASRGVIFLSDRERGFAQQLTTCINALSSADEGSMYFKQVLTLFAREYGHSGLCAPFAIAHNSRAERVHASLLCMNDTTSSFHEFCVEALS